MAEEAVYLGYQTHCSPFLQREINRKSIETPIETHLFMKVNLLYICFSINNLPSIRVLSTVDYNQLLKTKGKRPKSDAV